MSDQEHRDAIEDKNGVFYKYKSSKYRSQCEGCGRGYHSHRWQAHHVLPGMCFTNVDDFCRECLGVTPYNINRPYSMSGLPTLKGFIIYFRTREGVEDREKKVILDRWKQIRMYKYQKDWKVKFPGNFPCHQPVSFGHVIYNKEVEKHLQTKIWSELKKKKTANTHYDPESVYDKLYTAQQHFWDELEARGSIAPGIKVSFENRFETAGWWRPMCMTEVSAPISNGLF